MDGGTTKISVFEPTVAQNRRLEEANQFDRSLLEYGLARFERDLASYRNELGMEAPDRGKPIVGTQPTSTDARWLIE